MATTNTDFYELLGVARSASDDEIKKAYRARARELHPDANPNDPAAEDRFKQVTLAYEVLKDPEKRARYDQFGIDGLRGAGGGGGGGDPFGFGGGGLNDLFEAFFGGGNPFGGGGGRRQPSGPPRGGDAETSLELTFEQAVFGVTTDVTLRLPVACDTCSSTGAAAGTTSSRCTQCEGSGEVRRVRQSLLGQMVTTSACGRCGGTGQTIESPCQTCRGEGRRTEQRTYPVGVPAGVDDGTTLRLTGRGPAGPRGGPNGDLFVHLRVKPHDRFQREGYDLIEPLEIPMTQAALGLHLHYETLDGPEDLVIPAGTQTGRVFRLRERGVPVVNGRGRGDLLVQVIVTVPTQLTKDQEELLRSFAAMRGEEVAAPDRSLLGKIRSKFR
jgi:molecular chaperone DnaJ